MCISIPTQRIPQVQCWGPSGNCHSNGSTCLSTSIQTICRLPCILSETVFAIHDRQSTHQVSQLVDSADVRVFWNRSTRMRSKSLLTASQIHYVRTPTFLPTSFYFILLISTNASCSWTAACRFRGPSFQSLPRSQVWSGGSTPNGSYARISTVVQII